MYRSFLSWRYMTSRRTNWIGIVGIFVGVGALILILSIMAGFLDESRQMVRGSLADVIIEPHEMRPEYSQGGPGPVLDVVRQVPGVASATAQLHWVAIVTNEYTAAQMRTPNLADLTGTQIVGIDLEPERETTDFLASLEEIQDSYDKVADPEDPFAAPPGYEPDGFPLKSVIVGYQLMRALGIQRGREIDLMTVVPTEDGGVVTNNRRYIVAGGFRTGENEADLGKIYLEREELVDFVGETARYSQILVKLDDYDGQSEEVVTGIRDALKEAGLMRSGGYNTVRTWEQFKRNLIGAIENEKTLMAIMLSLVLLVAGFSVFAILSMLVTEKRRDIGILAALGATPRGILVLFVLIGFWDALLGAASGALAGVFLAMRIDPIERWLSDTLGIEIFNEDVYLFDHIPSVVDPFGVAMIVLGAFVCTLIFASLPAMKAARMHPIDALRYE